MVCGEEVKERLKMLGVGQDHVVYTGDLDCASSKTAMRCGACQVGCLHEQGERILHHHCLVCAVVLVK
jgi:hypothetical protein